MLGGYDCVVLYKPQHSANFDAGGYMYHNILLYIGGDVLV